MLVLVSDLHIADGSTSHNFNPEALRILAGEIRSAAADRRAREVEVVLCGDVLDLVRTDYWHEHVPAELRPWGGRLDPETAMNEDAAAVEAQYAAVLERILATDVARAGLGLQAFLAGLADHFGEQGIPFRATYVIGNHDRVLHAFPRLRERVRTAMPSIAAFVASFEAERYATVARHGHEWDVNCHAYAFARQVLKLEGKPDRFHPRIYLVQAIGEVVTAELMSGLVWHVRSAGGNADLVARLKDVNNLRPVTDVFEWLEWFGGAQTRAEQRMLHEALRASLDAVLDSSLAQLWDRLRTDLLVSGDLVDRLALARTLLLGDDFSDFRRRAKGLEALQAALAEVEGEDRLALGAGREYAGREGSLPEWTQHLIYGHTHRPRHDYLRADLDGIARMYINTGTYLPLISRARDNRSFATELQMTMILVYAEDEDTEGKKGGPSIDIWNGARRKQYA